MIATQLMVDKTDWFSQSVMLCYFQIYKIFKSKFIIMVGESRHVSEVGKNSSKQSALFTTQSQLLATFREKPIENITGKGENASYQHILLFPQCFLSTLHKINFNF